MIPTAEGYQPAESEIQAWTQLKNQRVSVFGEHDILPFDEQQSAPLEQSALGDDPAHAFLGEEFEEFTDFSEPAYEDFPYPQNPGEKFVSEVTVFTLQNDALVKRPIRDISIHLPQPQIPLIKLQEKPEKEQSEDIKFQLPSNEFQAIYAVQQESDKALGIQTSPTELLKRSYIISADIWKRRNFQQEGDLTALEALREQIKINHMTNIGERLSLIESTGRCILHNQDLHAEGYLKESLGQLMQRGIVVRAEERILQAKKGLPVNPDGPREEAEGKAWEKIKEELIKDITDKKRPVGRTALWYSPKSVHPDSSYYGNFVDTYTVCEKDGERFIDWQRLAVDWDNAAFTKSMTKYAPEFSDTLKSKEGTASFEVFVKETPIFVDQLPDFVMKKGMTKTDFEKVFRKVESLGLIKHYVDLVYTEPVDWLEIAKTFNTILHAADYFAEHADALGLPDVPDNERRRHEHVYDVRFLTSQWGIYIPQTTIGGACPPNAGQEAAGFIKKANIGNNTNAKMLSGTVGQFGTDGPDGKGSLDFECDVCGQTHTRPIGGYLKMCPVKKVELKPC